MLNQFTSSAYNKIFKIVFGLYSVFAVILIWRSSIVGIDGHRYFILFDDAMISMRYASNLVSGHGLVWNIGEKIEGFTNPLMVFIMAGGIRVFGENYAGLFIELLGLLCLFFNPFLVIKILNKLLSKRDDFLVFVGVLLVMGWYPIMYWSLFGMETGFLTTLVLLTVYLSLYKSRPKTVHVLLAVILGLIYLTRPEGALYIALFFGFRFLRSIYTKSGWLYVVIEAIITAIPVVAYQLFRLSYYGMSVPNTYILKNVGMPFLDKVKNGIGFYQPFFDRVEILVLVVVVFFFVYLFEGSSSLQEKVSEIIVGKWMMITLFMTSFTVYSVYQILVGGDAWPPVWRMFAPYAVLMFIAFIVAADSLKDSFAIRNDHFMALVSLAVFSFLVFVPYDYHYDFTKLQLYPTENNKVNVNSAIAINELTNASATVAVFAAGTIPYVTHRYSIDPLGKMDSYIAHLTPDLSGALTSSRGMYSVPGHNKYDLNYSFKEKKPDVIGYLSFYGHTCTWARDNLEDWCKNNYYLVEYRGAKVFLRKDSKNILWGKLGASNPTLQSK